MINATDRITIGAYLRLAAQLYEQGGRDVGAADLLGCAIHIIKEKIDTEGGPQCDTVSLSHIPFDQPF